MAFSVRDSVQVIKRERFEDSFIKRGIWFSLLGKDFNLVEWQVKTFTFKLKNDLTIIIDENSIDKINIFFRNSSKSVTYKVDNLIEHI